MVSAPGKNEVMRVSGDSEQIVGRRGSDVRRNEGVEHRPENENGNDAGAPSGERSYLVPACLPRNSEKAAGDDEETGNGESGEKIRDLIEWCVLSDGCRQVEVDYGDDRPALKCVEIAVPAPVRIGGREWVVCLIMMGQGKKGGRFGIFALSARFHFRQKVQPCLVHLLARVVG